MLKRKEWFGGPLDGLVGDAPAPLIAGVFYGPDPHDTSQVVVYRWDSGREIFWYDKDESKRLNATQNRQE